MGEVYAAIDTAVKYGIAAIAVVFVVTVFVVVAVEGR